MRRFFATFAACLALSAQAHRTAPAHNPAPPKLTTAPAPKPAATRVPRGIRHGGYIGGYYNRYSTEVLVQEPAPAPREDKLHELVVSPTYEKDKISPKLIEIPN